MANTNFTEKTTIVDNDFAIGFEAPASGGERKFRFSNIYNYIRSKLGSIVSYTVGTGADQIPTNTLVSSQSDVLANTNARHTQNTDQFLDFGGANQSTAAAVKTAVTKTHTQGTDQYLDQGGSNEVTAANAKDAVTKKHTQNTDQYLDFGGANQVTAAQIKNVVSTYVPIVTGPDDSELPNSDYVVFIIADQGTLEALDLSNISDGRLFYVADDGAFVYVDTGTGDYTQSTDDITRGFFYSTLLSGATDVSNLNIRNQLTAGTGTLSLAKLTHLVKTYQRTQVTESNGGGTLSFSITDPVFYAFTPNTNTTWQLPIVDTTSGFLSWTVTFKRMNAGVNILRITPNPVNGGTIDGASYVDITTQYETVTFSTYAVAPGAAQTWYIS